MPSLSGPARSGLSAPIRWTRQTKDRGSHPRPVHRNANDLQKQASGHVDSVRGGLAVLGIQDVRLLAFVLTAGVIIAIPGPSVLFIVSRALASGRRVAILSVLGNTEGEYLQVCAIAFGVGAIAERSVTAFTVMKAVGGLYLIYTVRS